MSGDVYVFELGGVIDIVAGRVCVAMFPTVNPFPPFGTLPSAFEKLAGRCALGGAGPLNTELSMALSADGRMQAIQVGNLISEQTVEQLMKLRQLMLVDLQSKQAFQAAQTQTEARGHAATEQFFNYVTPVRDGKTFSGGSK